MAVRRATFPSPPVLDEPASLAARLRAVAVLAARRRRLLAALCAGAAVLVAVSALTPQPIAAGAGAGNPPAALPPGAGARVPALADRLAVAVRLADPAGVLLLRVGSHAQVLAGAPADASTIPGTAPVPTGEVLAEDAVVLAVPQPPSPGNAQAAAPVSGLLGAGNAESGGMDGVVLLAVPPPDARRLAAAGGTRALSVAVALP
jgi:hypothetical protein